jgi:hypothetical protein
MPPPRLVRTDDRRSSTAAVLRERRQQAVARAAAYLAKWADDPGDLSRLERVERALRDALDSK